MYNNIGLQTPRGSGTSGRFQASKFLAKPRPSPSSSSASGSAGLSGPVDAAGGTRKPNKDILEHDRKRLVELRLLVLREALGEQGYTEAEIEARKAAEVKAVEEEGRPAPQGKGFMDTQSNHAAERKEKQLQKMRTALGLDDNDVEKKGGV